MNGFARPNPREEMGFGLPPSDVAGKKARAKGLLLWIGLFLIVLIATMAFVGVRYGPEWFRPSNNDVIYAPVKKEPIEVTVVEKGTLEAAKNDDVKCMVKATRGGQFATTIRWVIDDGTQVMTNRPEDRRSGVKGAWVWPHTGAVPKTARNGKPPQKDELTNPETAKAFERLKVWSDLLGELDRSGLEDQKLTQMIAVNKAEGDDVNAKADVEIVTNQNASDIVDAESKQKLAEIDLRKYVKIEYENQKADLEGKMEQAKDRSAWSRRMTAKGYVSFSQSEADRLSFQKLEGDLLALTDFTKERELEKLGSELKQAELKVKSTKAQAKAKLEKALKDLETKENVLKQEQEKLKDLEEQIMNCSLYAPRDGMALYYVSEQARTGFGAQQSTVAQGEPVREGQTLIRIPDLDHLLVNTKVHEAMVDKVKQGMRVDVRIDAFQNRLLKASVRNVATVAMQADWRSSPDVKMYQTMVQVDDDVANLKPGMTAEVTIHVDAVDKPVIAVPIQAVVGGPEMGASRKVFVKGANGQPEEREVKVGLVNERVAEIREGVSEGDEVVLNPKVLVGDRVKTRQPGEFEKKKNGEGNGNGEAKPAADAKPGDAKPAATPGKAPATGGAGGAPAAGGPGAAGAGGAGAGGAGGAGAPSADQMGKQMEAFNSAMRKGTPEERKKLLEQVPEQYRKAAKERFEQQGLKIAD